MLDAGQDLRIPDVHPRFFLAHHVPQVLPVSKPENREGSTTSGRAHAFFGHGGVDVLTEPVQGKINLVLFECLERVSYASLPYRALKTILLYEKLGKGFLTLTIY